MMDAEGNELVAENADEPFVPASVTKIVTAWLCVEVLGGDYRFETRFYLDDKRVLYVRVRFVISLTSSDDEMLFRLLRAIGSGL